MEVTWRAENCETAVNNGYNVGSYPLSHFGFFDNAFPPLI